MDAVALSLLSLYVILKRKKQQAKRKRLHYIRPPHASMFALQYGMEIFERYYRSDDPKDLRSFCRLSPRRFDEFLELVEDKLAEEGATAVKWAHFESMGFLRDKQHQEERYSNLSQIIMEADENEASQPRGSKRGRGDDEGTEITAALDLMKAHVEKPSFAYKHTIAKNVDDVMDKLENLGLVRDKVKLRVSLQRLLDDCKLKILDAEKND